MAHRDGNGPRLRAAVNGFVLAILAGALPVGSGTVVAAPERAQVPSLAELLAVSDPPVLSQQAYIKSSITSSGNNLGASVAVSGDTLVVGLPGESSNAVGVNGTINNSRVASGAAYVFVRSAGAWSQQAFFKASNPGEHDEFGSAVAISGDTIVVAAENEDSNATGVNGDQTNDTVTGSGAAYVFVRSGGVWTQQAYLKASNTGQADLFGHSVAVDGDTIVVGAHQEDGAGVITDNFGAAYVFARSDGAWSQQAYLQSSNPGIGDAFGISVAVDGDLAVVGAHGEDSNAVAPDGDQADNSASGAGAAYVFSRSGTTWSQEAYLKASNTDPGDGFGRSVALSGTTVLIGAPSEDSNATGAYGDQENDLVLNAGAAFVISKSGSDWIHEAYLKASNAGPTDSFGLSVALDGDVAVIGTSNEDSRSIGVNRPANNDASTDAGAAYVYRRSGATWSFGDYLKASNTDPGDFFGNTVAVSGTTILVGAPLESSEATGVDGDGADNSEPFSGAAYVYGPPCAKAPFSDVGTNQAFCAEIEWMKQSKISTGFNDGTYQPVAPVTRQAMSAFMARFADAVLAECTEPPFIDVPIDHPFCKEIQWMKEEEISVGFDDGTYRPAINVTRQAMSAFMARLAQATLGNCRFSTAPFSDVPTDHPFCEEIQWMKDNGISTGFNDGTYRPSIDVTRQAMSAFIYRLNNLLNHF